MRGSAGLRSGLDTPAQGSRRKRSPSVGRGFGAVVEGVQTVAWPI